LLKTPARSNYSRAQSVAIEGNGRLEPRRIDAYGSLLVYDWRLQGRNVLRRSESWRGELGIALMNWICFGAHAEPSVAVLRAEKYHGTSSMAMLQKAERSRKPENASKGSLVGTFYLGKCLPPFRISKSDLVMLVSLSQPTI
jgi:hypothetical protein